MGNVVEMPKRNCGNGAREAVMEIVRSPHFRKPLGEWDVNAVADCFLMELLEYGYKVVRISDRETSGDKSPA